MVKFKYVVVFASFIFLTLTDASFAMKGDDFDPEASGSSSLHSPGPQDEETLDQQIQVVQQIQGVSYEIRDLPEEICYYIFSFLPLSDLFNGLYVCHGWHPIISDSLDWLLNQEGAVYQFLNGDYSARVLETITPQLPLFIQFIDPSYFHWIANDPIRFTLVRDPVREALQQEDTPHRGAYKMILQTLKTNSHPTECVSSMAPWIYIGARYLLDGIPPVNTPFLFQNSWVRHAGELLNREDVDTVSLTQFFQAYYYRFPFDSAQAENWQVKELKRNLLKGYVETAQWEAAFELLRLCGSQVSWHEFACVLANNEGEISVDDAVPFLHAYYQHFPFDSAQGEAWQVQALKKQVLEKYVDFPQWENAFELLELCGSQDAWHDFFRLVDNKGEISANDVVHVIPFLHAYYQHFPFDSAQEKAWQVKALKRNLLKGYVETAQWENASNLLELYGSQDDWRDFFNFLAIHFFFSKTEETVLYGGLGEISVENLCNTVLSIVRFYELFPSSPTPNLIGMVMNRDLIRYLSPEDATLFLRTLLENSSADDDISIIQEAVCLHALCHADDLELQEWGQTCLALCEGTIAEFQWKFLEKSFLFHQQESQAEKRDVLKKIISKESFVLTASSLYVHLHMAQQIETQSDVINKDLRSLVLYLLKEDPSFHNAPQFDAYRPFLQQLFYEKFFDKKGRPLKKISKKYQAIYDLLFPS